MAAKDDREFIGNLQVSYEQADSDSDLEDEEDYLEQQLAILKSLKPDVYKDVVDLGEFLRDRHGGSIYIGESKIYVPRCLRAYVEDRIAESNQKNTLLVSYLPFHKSNSHSLLEIFKPFGHVTAADVAIDPKSNIGKDYGFVDFLRKEDAQLAVHKLSQHGIKGYGKGYLKVEWAADVPIVEWTLPVPVKKKPSIDFSFSVKVL